MGFLELAAALKFLGNTDIALNPGNPRLFNYETVLCAWIALSLACGLYLLGTFRLPHDSPTGAYRRRPHAVGDDLPWPGPVHCPGPLARSAARAPSARGWSLSCRWIPRSESAGGGEVAQAHLDWHKDYRDSLGASRQGKQADFYRFHGRQLHQLPRQRAAHFRGPPCARSLGKYVRVQLYTDSVPKQGLSAAQATAEAERNQNWQDQTFQTSRRPSTPSSSRPRTSPFVDGKLNGTVLGTKGGTIPTTRSASSSACCDRRSTASWPGPSKIRCGQAGGASPRLNTLTFKRRAYAPRSPLLTRDAP